MSDEMSLNEILESVWSDEGWEVVAFHGDGIRDVSVCCTSDAAEDEVCDALADHIAKAHNAWLAVQDAGIENPEAVEEFLDQAYSAEIALRGGSHRCEQCERIGGKLAEARKALKRSGNPPAGGLKGESDSDA